jgi:hypothetical protein
MDKKTRLAQYSIRHKTDGTFVRAVYHIQRGNAPLTEIISTSDYRILHSKGTIDLWLNRLYALCALDNYEVVQYTYHINDRCAANEFLGPIQRKRAIAKMDPRDIVRLRKEKL